MPYDPERHGPERVVGPGFHRQVFELVRRVPTGRVTTYGDIAKALGLSGVARHVGFALAAICGETRDVPWHRVVNAAGRLSARGSGGPSEEQRRRLEAEGHTISSDGRISDFARLRWLPSRPPPPSGLAHEPNSPRASPHRRRQRPSG